MNIQAAILADWFSMYKTYYILRNEIFLIYFTIKPNHIETRSFWNNMQRNSRRTSHK